jgi:hypothetical protein
MTEHKCVTGRWVEGVVADCRDCRPPVERKAPGHLRENYRASTQHVIKDSRGSREIQHWSGRQDAHVVAKPVASRAKTKEI